MALGSKKYNGMSRRVAVIFSVAGVLFCVLAAIGLADRLCVTSGCDLYHDWAVLGLSLWWWGAGAFGLLGVCALAWPPAALGLASLILAVDTLLLIAMALLAPCGNCIIAGVGFFLVWLFLCRATGERSLAVIVLSVLWIAALSPNLLALVADGGGWAVYGPENARVRVYFSPSCPHCRNAVRDLTAWLPGEVAFIPVSESERDVESIIAMHKAVEQGVPFRTAYTSGILAALAPKKYGFMETLVYRLRIARNHAVFRRMGATSVPQVVMTGWGGDPFRRTRPQAPGEPRPQPAPEAAPAPAPEAAPQAAPAPAPEQAPVPAPAQ